MNLPLTLDLRLPRRLLVIQLIAHAWAGSVLLLLLGGQFRLLTLPGSSFPGLALAVLLLLVLWSARQNWRQLMGPQRICRLRLLQDGKLEFLRKDSEGSELSLDACVDGQTLVTPWLIVMRLRLPDSRRLISLTLLGDSLSAGEFRQLRLWLRWFAINPAMAEAR